MKALTTIITTVLVWFGLYLLIISPTPDPDAWYYYFYIGFSEEAIKILLILPIFFWRKRDYRVFLLSALCFACTENVMYMISSDAPIYTGLIRLVSLVLHLGFAVWFATFSAYALKFWKGVLGGYLVASCMHAIIDILLTGHHIFWVFLIGLIPIYIVMMSYEYIFTPVKAK